MATKSFTRTIIINDPVAIKKLQDLNCAKVKITSNKHSSTPESVHKAINRIVHKFNA